MTRGEDLMVLVDYDLFGLNVKGKVGVFLKVDESTGKSLIHFPQNGEYGELLPSQYERVSPGVVSEKNEDFISNIHTMKITFPT